MIEGEKEKKRWSEILCVFALCVFECPHAANRVASKAGNRQASAAMLLQSF